MYLFNNSFVFDLKKGEAIVAHTSDIAITEKGLFLRFQEKLFPLESVLWQHHQLVAKGKHDVYATICGTCGYSYYHSGRHSKCPKCKSYN